MKRSLILLVSLLLYVGTMWAQTFPETSTAEAPKYYTIASYSRGGYLTSVGEGKGVEHIATTKGSLWYFVQADENGGLYFCNMAGGFLAADKTVSETAGVWYVLSNGVNTEGASISSTNPISSGSCVDANNYNTGVGAWHPQAGDWEGTTWVFAEVTDFSTIFNVDEAKAAAKAELDVLASVSVIYPDAAEAKAAIDAVEAEGTGSSQLSAAIAAVNQCVDDYKAAALQALGGRYFAINTPARESGFMKLAGNQVSGAADASSSAAIWQFEYADGVVKVFNPYTGKYLCEPGNNSAIVAVTENAAAAGAYQLVVNADAENEEAKVKLTSNGKSIHMASNSVLVRWDDGGASEWTVAEVEADITKDVVELLEANAGNHAAVPALGQYSTAGYTALQEAQHTATTFKQVADAVAAFEATKCLPVFTIDGVYNYALGMSVYESEDGSLLWRETERTESMLWTFDMTDTIVGVTDKVVVRNLATGNLFWGASFIQVTETSEADADDGLFLFYTEGTGAPVHAAQAGQTIVRWNNLSANSASAWQFTFAGTTYSINDLPEVPDTPVVPDTPEGVVNDLASADATKCYSITTMGRGGWTVDAAGTLFTCTTAEGLTVDDSDPRQQFAILSLNAQDYYLYSVSAKKFVKRDGSLVAGVADAIEFVDASSMGAGRVMVRFDEDHNINVSDVSRCVEINTWSLLDEGNAVAIIEAGDFDATEALAMLSSPVVPDTSSVGLTDLSAADPTKCYTISTNGRGAWAINADGTYFSTTGVEGFNVDAADARQQFAILSANGEDYYLYSVSAKKFVKCDRSLVTGVADALEFVDASSKGEGRVMVRFRDFLNSNINIGGDNQMVINGWNLIDEGNAVLIAEADDFDATEALAILANPEEAERNALIAQALELLEANADNHAVEPALGQYATRTYEYLDSVANSEEVTKNVIEDAISLFEASKCLPVFTINGVADFVAGKSIYEFNGRLYWTATDRTDESMLWMFDMTDTIVDVTDKVVVKNLATGRLFDNALFVQVAEPQDGTEGYWICPEGLGVPMFAYEDGRVERAYSWTSDSPHTWEFVYAGTTYDINELPSEPETPDTPVVPDSAVAASMPLKYMSGENGWIEGTEWIDEELGFVGYASPLYVFEEKVETFRIIVKRVQSGDKFFSLSELGFFDADGNKIELTEANVTSNADHNTLNPGRPDGGGIAALFDEDVNTYFHSAWQNIPQGDHYLEVTLPNGGYDAFSFEMISRGGQTRIFPEEMVITDAFQYELLDALYGSTGDINLCPFPEVGYYYDDLSYIEEAFSKTYELLVNNGSEAECEAMVAELTQALERYRSMDVRLPEPDKGYRVISAFPGFAEHQLVEKAITINPESNALWWEDVCADNEMQEFIFEPVLGDSGQHLSWVMDINYRGSVVTEKQYFYNMKNAATGLYVNYSPEANFHLVDQPCTVYLAPLGGGQFGIRFRIANEYGGGTIYAMHAGDHNEGYPSDSIGDYGGTFGMSSGIVSWYGEDHTASAWFIRETHELPYTMPVSEDKFKSGFVHFEATDVITLTADKECSFANLEFYSSYGYGYASSWNEGIEIEKCEVSGNTATITLDRKVTSCAFGFDNYEGVSSVTFDAMSSAAEGPSLQLVGVTPDSETSNAWVRALTLSFNKEIAVWGLGDFLRGINTGEEFYISSHHIGENSDGGYDLTLYFSGRRDGWSKLVTVPDTYTYTIPAGTIKSVDGEDFPETTITFTVDGTFSVENYSPAETTSLEQIELTFDRVIEDITIYYGWYVENEEGDNVAYIDWGRGHGSKTVTLGLNEPITTPGKYYLHIFADAFTAEGDMPNMPADLTFIVVEDTPEVSTDYAMKAQDAKGRTSSVVNIPIEMDNVTAVNAFQFDLYLPEGISVVSTMEDDELIYDITFNDERAESTHVLAASLQANGALRVVAYSTANAVFAANDGVVVNVAVSVDKSVAEGSYPVTLRNIRMVKSGGSEVLGADHTSTLTISQNALMGDVNSDEQHTMADVVMMVNAVLEKVQENFAASVADMNGDGDITMADVVSVLRLVLGYESTAAARSAIRGAMIMPELHTGDMVAMGNGRMVLPVTLNNAEAYSAFQLDVVLPAGVEVAEATLTGRAKASHVVAWNTLADGTTRVVAYAMDNAAFRGNEGVLLNLVLEASDNMPAAAMLTITDGLFATVGGAEHGVADINVMMRSDATAIDEAYAATFRAYGVNGAVEVVCGAETVVSIYAAAGQLVRQTTVKAGKNTITLPAGVYIVNGNKIIVK